MESKKRRAQEERRTLNKAQEVHFASEFRSADRAAQKYSKSLNE